MLPRLNGRRGAFLLSFGVIYVAIGLNYIIVDPGSAVRAAMAWMPAWSTIQVCGLAWCAAGLVAMVSAFARMPRDRFGFIALAAWSTAWAIAWAIAAALGYAPRGYVGALVFATLTVAPMAVSGLPNPVRRGRRQERHDPTTLGISRTRSLDVLRVRRRRADNAERFGEGGSDVG
jgi:hypothetical protein